MMTKKKRGRSHPRMTTQHAEIRRWTEERGGRPSRVVGTGGREDVEMIRLEFPGYSGEGGLEPISWGQFFEKFDENNLALIFQEETEEGEKSNFNKLIRRAPIPKNQASPRDEAA
jgi:hypothetical protein